MPGSDDNDEYMKSLEAQRRAFEAQFGSLEEMGFEDKTKNVSDSASESEDAEQSAEEEDDDDEEEDEDDEAKEQEEVIPIVRSNNHQSRSATQGPKVIKFNGPDETYTAPDKQEQKLVRSGKTLAEHSRRMARNEMLRSRQKNQSRNGNEDDTEENDQEVEAENLKNDVELQQFIRESHLLSAFSNNNSNDSVSGVGLTLSGMNSKDDSIVYQDEQVMGKARMKTLESRLQRISQTNGNGKKINKLEKVPMAVRKGMIDKHVKRIAKYEQDAAEGGIVLSKVRKGQFRKIESTYKKDIERRIGSSIKSKDLERTARRERGLKINTIGRSTRNGLIVSKEEIARINGSPSSSNRGGRGGGRGRARGKDKGRRH